jgi:predicted nucleic acid-binding protein
MNRFVLDCSVAMAWCFEDEADVLADAALRALADHEARVPGLWPLEVANVLALAERRGRLSGTDLGLFLARLGRLPIRVDAATAEHALGESLTLARTHRLTAYDAAYLELALREGLPLVTLDSALREAAERAGVVLWGPPGSGQ